MNPKTSLIKGALLGLCLGVMAMLAVGNSYPSSNQIGRYQVTSSAAMFVIVDTTTGQAWMGDFHNTLVPADPSFFTPKLQIVAP